MTHHVTYKKEGWNSWWFVCHTCGDEGGPCETYDQLVNLDIQHEKDYEKELKRKP